MCARVSCGGSKVATEPGATRFSLLCLHTRGVRPILGKILLVASSGFPPDYRRLSHTDCRFRGADSPPGPLCAAAATDPPGSGTFNTEGTALLMKLRRGFALALVLVCGAPVSAATYRTKNFDVD